MERRLQGVPSYQQVEEDRRQDEVEEVHQAHQAHRS